MRETLKSLGVLALLAGGIFILFFVANKYDAWEAKQPKPRSIVYACPIDKSVKCYKLEADILIDCDDDGEGHRYCSGTVARIYFPNKGYIEFDYCDEEEENEKFVCYPIDDNDQEWIIDNTGEKTKIKYPPR